MNFLLKNEIMAKAVGLILMCLFQQFSIGQKNQGAVNSIWGINYGVNAFDRTSIEVGYGFVTSVLYHKGEKSTIWDRSLLITADLSSEFQVGKQFLLGPKISNKYSFEMWDWEFNYLGFIFGADFIVYTDFGTTNSVLRPSIGFHYFIDVFELTYGYNFRIDDHSPLPINQHVIQFKFKPFIFIKSMKNAWG